MRLSARIKNISKTPAAAAKASRSARIGHSMQLQGCARASSMKDSASHSAYQKKNEAH